MGAGRYGIISLRVFNLISHKWVQLVKFYIIYLMIKIKKNFFIHIAIHISGTKQREWCVSRWLVISNTRNIPISRVPRSCERNFLQLRMEACKFQDFNWVRTRDLAKPVRGHGFKPRSSLVFFIYFIYHFIIHSFLTDSLEPTNDQLSTSVAS